MQKITIVLVVFLLVLLVFGCTQQQSVNQTYKNENFGIIFSYDTNLSLDSWSLSDYYVRLTKNYPNEDVCEITITKDLVSDVQNSFSYNKSTYNSDVNGLDTNLTLEEYRQFMEAHKSRDYNVEVLENEYVDLSGVKMWKITSVKHFAEDLHPKSTSLYGILHNYFYQLTAGTYKSDDFNSCSAYFETVLNSFSFTNNGN